MRRIPDGHRYGAIGRCVDLVPDRAEEDALRAADLPGGGRLDEEVGDAIVDIGRVEVTRVAVVESVEAVVAIGRRGVAVDDVPRGVLVVEADIRSPAEAVAVGRLTARDGVRRRDV